MDELVGTGGKRGFVCRDVRKFLLFLCSRIFRLFFHHDAVGRKLARCRMTGSFHPGISRTLKLHFRAANLFALSELAIVRIFPLDFIHTRTTLGDRIK